LSLSSAGVWVTINLSETEKDSIGQIHAMFLRWKTIKTRGLNHILYKRHRVASKMTPRKKQYCAVDGESRRA